MNCPPSLLLPASWQSLGEPVSVKSLDEEQKHTRRRVRGLSVDLSNRGPGRVLTVPDGSMIRPMPASSHRSMHCIVLTPYRYRNMPEYYRNL